MKTIIAGSRTGFSYSDVEFVLFDRLDKISEIVSGTAQGIDRFGELFGIQNNIPVKRFPADWCKFGKSAGPIRNQQMAEYADALIAFWDGESRGTKNMIETAERLGLAVSVVTRGSIEARKIRKECNNLSKQERSELLKEGLKVINGEND